MGNLAMTSCVQVSTGPAQFCVQVLLADGKLVQFPQPVLAIQVMQDHPGHLVVKFSTWESPASTDCRAPLSSYNANPALIRQAGRLVSSKSKRSPDTKSVNMLRADEKLELGSTYYLLPIVSEEDERKKSYFKSMKLASSKVASSFEYEFQNEVPSPEKRLKASRRINVASVQQESQLQQQRRYHQEQEQVAREEDAGRTVLPTLGKLLMEGTGREHCSFSLHTNGMERRRGRSRRQRRLSQITWMPILESIPEVADELFDEDDFASLRLVKSHSRISRHDRPRLVFQ